MWQSHCVDLCASWALNWGWYSAVTWLYLISVYVYVCYLFALILADMNYHIYRTSRQALHKDLTAKINRILVAFLLKSNDRGQYDQAIWFTLRRDKYPRNQDASHSLNTLVNQLIWLFTITNWKKKILISFYKKPIFCYILLSFMIIVFSTDNYNHTFSLRFHAALRPSTNSLSLYYWWTRNGASYSPGPMSTAEERDVVFFVFIGRLT